MVAPLAIRLEAAFVRGMLGDLVLREGMMLAARVLDRSGRHGTLSLAGRQIAAELPDTVAAGQEVRLRVDELGAERVVLRIVDQEAQAAAPPAPPLLIALPGGLEARIGVHTEEEEGGDGGRETAAATVVVSYDSPALGAMELRLVLEPAALRATVEAPPGGAEAARAAAEELREALAAVAGRPAEVRIVERRDPVDVYA